MTVPQTSGGTPAPALVQGDEKDGRGEGDGAAQAEKAVKSDFLKRQAGW